MINNAVIEISTRDFRMIVLLIKPNMHGSTVTGNNNNDLMLQKQSNEEKTWYGFHIERKKE